MIALGIGIVSHSWFFKMSPITEVAFKNNRKLLQYYTFLSSFQNQIPRTMSSSPTTANGETKTPTLWHSKSDTSL